MTTKRILIVAGVVVAALGSGGWLMERASGPTAAAYQQSRLFDDVLAHVADYYVDSIDESKLYQMAIDGMLDQLHDPYSVYLKPEDFSALNEQTTGNYGGVGLQIDVRDGWITVVAPLPDTPAERAGVLSGDRVIALDGRSTEGWKQDDAVKQLRGDPGSTAELTVRRVGVEQPMKFKLTRAVIHIRAVPIAMMLDDRVGYVQLNPVNATSGDEVETAVDSLMHVGMKSLILDLRGNPGGYLNQAVAVSDLFLDPGQEVVEQRGRAPGSTETYRDSRPQRWPNLPIVVLTNGYTASAAEIITGALQDHDRAVVIGTPTFGKGLVQSVWQLTDKTALKLTTARWYTPSGRTIQRKSTGEADQVAQAVASEVNPDTLKPDSTQVFHTDHGRTMLGGGGIRPDVFVAPDTLTVAERAFRKALGAKWPLYLDALATYSLDLKAQGKLGNASFAVTDDMVSEIVRRMRTRGATLADSVVAGARPEITREIGYEAARYLFGRPAEFRREMSDDREVQAALSYARRARSPQDLIALLGTAGAPAHN